MFSMRLLKLPWASSCAGAITFLVLLGAFIFPLLPVGFVGDDIYRSTIPAYAALAHLSVLGALRDVFREADQTARSPLQVLVLAFWFLRPPEIVARIAQCVLLIVNVATFALLAVRLFGARGMGIVAAVCAFATLQIRLGNDAILGQTATSTLGCELILLALLAWQRFCEKATWARFGAAMAAFAIALAGDASAVSLVAVIPVLFALETRWEPRNRFLGGIAFVAAGAIVLALNAILVPGAIVLPSLAATFGQLAAAIPLAYRTVHDIVSGGVSPGGTPPDQRFLGVPGAGVAGFVLATGGMVAAYVALRWGAPSRRTSVVRAGAIGAALWIVPALLAGHAASTLLQPLPIVYVQSYGVALLLAAGLEVIFRLDRLGRAPGLAPIALLFVGLTLLGNAAEARVVAQRSAGIGAVRSAIERAGAAGLFGSIADGSRVLLDAKSYPFLFTNDWRSSSYLLYAYSGRSYVSAPVGSFRPLPGKRETWIMRYSENAEAGLRQLALARFAAGSASAPRVDETTVFQRYDTTELRTAGLSALDAGGRGMNVSTSEVGEKKRSHSCNERADRSRRMSRSRRPHRLFNGAPGFFPI